MDRPTNVAATTESSPSAVNDKPQLEPTPTNGGGDGSSTDLERQFAESLIEQVFREALEFVAQRRGQQHQQQLQRDNGFGAMTQVGDDEVVFEIQIDEDERGSVKQRRQSAATEGLADDEFSEDEEEQGGSTTLIAGAHLNLDGRGYSTSPSQLDGSDLMQDLHEMSDYADKIDSILDRQASSYGHSSLDSRARSAERQFGSPTTAAPESDYDDEID